MGYWIFNTNETNGPGAYVKMFENDVAAIYGYEDGPKKLRGAKPGNIVFAYVNGHGIRAVGRVVSGEVVSGTGIFLDRKGNQQPEEYHLQVKGEVQLSKFMAITPAEAKKLGVGLAVRCTFGRMSDVGAAGRLEEVVRGMGR